MWESRRLWARFPRGAWKEGEAWFWLSTLSTARHFQGRVSGCAASPEAWRRGRLWALQAFQPNAPFK
jgi:hypothetical protein